MINGDSHLLPGSSDFSLMAGCGGGGQGQQPFSTLPVSISQSVRLRSLKCMARHNSEDTAMGNRDLLTFSPFGPPIPGNPGGP